MRDPKKYTVPVLAAIFLALVLLICLETFVVPVDWIGTHHAIHSLIVLTCLQPILLWEERQWQDERERKCSNDERERKRSN
jgi:hypothetical protein